VTSLPDEILSRCAEWQLLSLLFSRPRPGWLEEVSALVADLDEGPLRRAALEAADANEGSYHALLGAGGPASPREAGHLGFGDPGRVLADLAARYSAFGFSPRAEEPDDHLAVECSFVSYLFLKEAFALASGEEEPAQVTRDAREGFLREHVAVAGRRMIEKLPPEAPAYLLTAAESLAARLPDAPPLPECEAPEELDGCFCPMA
jgi:hypothetical protein